MTSDVSFLLIAATILSFLVVVYIIVFFLFHLKKSKSFQREKEQLQMTFQQELLRTQLEIQEQTFLKISQEIHDNIGQALILAKMNITLIDINNSSNRPEKIKETEFLLEKAIRDLRNLAKTINSDYIIDLGLLNAIRFEINLISKIVPFQINFSIEGEEYEIEQQYVLIIFRIFQEILNNVIKHSKAVKVDIIIGYKKEGFVLEVIDNGQGYTPFSKSGLGINNMHRRSQLIGAILNINSTAGVGTSVKLFLPA
jgi:two-component system NarL family sensor kinase